MMWPDTSNHLRYQSVVLFTASVRALSELRLLLLLPRSSSFTITRTLFYYYFYYYYHQFILIKLSFGRNILTMRVVSGLGGCVFTEYTRSKRPLSVALRSMAEVMERCAEYVSEAALIGASNPVAATLRQNSWFTLSRPILHYYSSRVLHRIIYSFAFFYA